MLTFRIRHQKRLFVLVKKSANVTTRYYATNRITKLYYWVVCTRIAIDFMLLTRCANKNNRFHCTVWETERNKYMLVGAGIAWIYNISNWQMVSVAAVQPKICKWFHIEHDHNKSVKILLKAPWLMHLKCVCLQSKQIMADPYHHFIEHKWIIDISMVFWPLLRFSRNVVIICTSCADVVEVNWSGLTAQKSISVGPFHQKARPLPIQNTEICPICETVSDLTEQFATRNLWKKNNSNWKQIQ